MAMKLVEFSLQSIMGKLQKMLQDEAALLAGVEDDVRFIVSELRSINSFLTAMSTRRNLDAQLQNWVQDVRELAYDAEDSIDEFVCRLGSTPDDQHGVKGFFNGFLRCVEGFFNTFFCCLKSARHGIASELKNLKVQVEEIKKRHDRYSHPTEPSTSSGTDTRIWDMADSYSDPRINSLVAEEAQLVGINESRDKLIEWVMEENRLELTVISLVGFGGLGKTTLAKVVYDNPIIVGGHFQPQAWIAVSQNYNIRELLKKIICQISVDEKQIRDVSGCHDRSLNTEQILNQMDEPQLVQTVRAHLREKRYLLVFDDVWSTGAWESLRNTLPPGEKGSRVIVTTRKEEVANIACSPRNHQFIFKVPLLSPELSWELFCRKAFDAPDYNCAPELETVGREILQKCDGLPLAIVTIGGLLASKPNKQLKEWKDLHDHLPWEIQNNDMLSKIHQILILSYNDLPYHLKPCLLFLGIFPEDYEIRRKRLMRRWIAEGIVSGESGLPAEKVAERRFNQLVDRSLVQPSQFDENGKVKSCRVHDMMLEVILFISEKENFVVLLKEHSTSPPQHQKKRRLSCHEGSSGKVPDIDLSHLRSFTAFGRKPLKDYRKQMLLRAIDLEGCRAIDHFHPESFSKLFLLKYLSLRDSRIYTLPDSIGDLQNLEFLDLRGTFIQELPNTIVRLQKLVYLLATPPPYMMRDPLLRVPKGLGKLKRLVAFGMAYADDEQSLQEICELVGIQKLGIFLGHARYYGQSDRMLEKFRALLLKFNGTLRSLRILHRHEINLKKALDEVASPPLLLCKLHIDCGLGKLPCWFASLQHVVKITLYHTRLKLEDLQDLRNLQALIKLKLGFKSFVRENEDLVFDREGFAQLKFLDIEKHNVRFKVGAIPSLEILKIYLTPKSVNGIEHLRGLREVHIRSEDESRIEEVKIIAANHPNRPKCFAIQGTS